MVNCSYLGDVLLCRSALEYALVDRAEILGIEITCGPGGSRPDRTLKNLSHLIEETIASRPQLEGDLELIKKHGNLVAHPKTAVNPGTADADITRGLALESIKATLRVLTDVYG